MTGAPRYPGSPPFSDSPIDRLLFHGRRAEAEALTSAILSEDLVMVYGVSGTGKTSLLQAGVFHRLRAAELWPVVVRLNDPSLAPNEVIASRMVEQAAADGLELLPPAPAGDDLWDLLSGLEVWDGDVLLAPVLVLDQFEELFTLDWDPEVRERFMAEFGWVSRGHRPLEHGGVVGRPPAVKSVVLIREDSLGELEALAGHVPGIMRNRFRLRPLDLGQAEEAIRGPAGLVDERLGTPPFAYADDAVDLMLDFLRTREERGQTVKTDSVEPSQLQIICQYVEDVLVGTRGGVVIAAADLGGRQGLNRILRDFYRRALASLPDEYEAPTQRLCEQGLINAAGRRLSLEVGEIDSGFAVPEGMLEMLVEARLLRAESRTGSRYYELAHDSLVRPILDDRAERLRTQAEARRRLYREWLVPLAVVAMAVAIVVAHEIGSLELIQQFQAFAPEREATRVQQTVSGQVRDDDGEGLAGATVHFHAVFEGDANGGVAELALTGGDGRFEQLLPEGVYRVEVTARGYRDAWWGGAEPAATFAEADSITIAQSGDPPAEVMLRLEAEIGEIRYVAAAGGNDVSVAIEPAALDASQLNNQGVITVRTPGTYVLTLTAPEFEREQIEVALAAGQSIDLGTVVMSSIGGASEITLVKRIEGSVDATLTGREVEFEYEIANNSTRDVVLEGARIVDSAIEGEVPLSNLTIPGKSIVTRTETVIVPAGARCPETEETEAVLFAGDEFVTSASASYCISAAPVEVVVFNDLDGDGRRDTHEPGLRDVEVFVRGADGLERARAITDEFGAAVFSGVLEGDYVVGIELAPGSRAGQQGVEQPVAVGAEPTEKVFAVEVAGELSGIVTIGGDPVGGLTVVRDGGLASTTTDADGRYRFAAYRGPYTISLPGGVAPEGEGSKQAVVPDDPTADFELAGFPALADLGEDLGCGDLRALRFTRADADEYWERVTEGSDGEPDRLDVDGNDVPCEAVFGAAPSTTTTTSPVTTVPADEGAPPNTGTG